MDFRIADTFTASLARLTGEEQKVVKTTAFDLQLNPANPGMQFHKLDKSKDKNFWSVRVGADLRLIVHRSDSSLLLCYADHHDKAYAWAERRKIETHPKTFAAQLVEIRESVREIVVPIYMPQERQTPASAVVPKPLLFATRTEDELLGVGVPPEWLADVREATEDSLLVLAEHLPSEAAEALLVMATGGEVRTELSATPVTPFEHPDARRRFRVMANVEELELALASPWDRWTVFLHPAQRELVERNYSGPARVSGSAGTGKTVVALHRAVFLARSNPDARVLLTTFSDTLASALRKQLKRLIGDEPRLGERIDVLSLDGVGTRLHRALIGEAKLATRDMVRGHIGNASSRVGDHKFGMHFLADEFDRVVDAWQLSTWEAYRDVARLGRKTRLPEAQRAKLWSIFELVRQSLRASGVITVAELYAGVTGALSTGRAAGYDSIVVDEAQDLSVPQLKMLAALGGGRPNALFFAGDLGQRIFQEPFSWKSLGVEVRGRSRTLRVNYRTSHQIRAQADRLLGPTVTDLDGLVEQRRGTVSVFNGPAPAIRAFKTEKEEMEGVAAWLKEQAAAGVLSHECGIIVRSEAELPRAQAAVREAGLPYRILDDRVETATGFAAIGTMHLAKGLEFRSVAVMACDDEVIPSQARIEQVGDDADLQEVYDTERSLLYVACTRARDHLLVTSVRPSSEFLDDMQ